MLAHEVDRGAVDWAAVQVGGASWENLDPLEFERLRRLASSSGTGADGVLASLSDREIASALGLVRSDADVTAGALLLFGKSDALRRFLPTHEAAFQVLRGEEVEVNDFLPYPQWVLEQENQQGRPFGVSELQLLAELMRERRSTTQSWRG